MASVEVAEVEGRRGVVALKNIVSGTQIFQIAGKVTVFSFEHIYGFSRDEEENKDFFILNEEKSDNQVCFNVSEHDNELFKSMNEESVEIGEEISFKTFGDYHRKLKEYDKQAANSRLELKQNGKNNFEVFVTAIEDIDRGTEVRALRGKEFWMRKYLRESDNPLERLMFLIFLEAFNTPEQLSEELKGFEHFFIKWRVWSQSACDEFLNKILKISRDGNFIENLGVLGYPPRTVLYRMLQTVGAIKPPTVASYKNYPEALRPVAHQSRDLCFWPVPIGPPTDPIEGMRRKMQLGLEFGPNATWTNFPKTKQVFMAAMTDNLSLVQEVVRADTVNLSSYGSCRHWTPLHVACHYGSLKVAKFLLSQGAVFNSIDTSGLTPLRLAEQAGHTNLARLLLAHYADQTVLPDTTCSLLKVPDLEDPKQASLGATINCKNVGNTAFKNKNYKSAFQFYSRGLDLCPEHHPEKVFLLSNRAQVLITAKAFNLALRDINRALGIDPIHEKTILRRAHCYESVNPEKSLTDLDLLLYISVPDKLVNDRRTFIFLKTILKNAEQTENSKVEEGTELEDKDKPCEDLVKEFDDNCDSSNSDSDTDSVKIQGTRYHLSSVPMALLLDLSLQDLRDLDSRVGQFDQKNNPK